MPTRNAEATWRGNLKEGSGDLAVGSGAFEGPYSFMSRFEDGDATNPEELIGAAHAGCFAMALGNALDENGFEADELHVEVNSRLLRSDTYEIECPNCSFQWEIGFDPSD